MIYGRWDGSTAVRHVVGGARYEGEGPDKEAVVCDEGISDLNRIRIAECARFWSFSEAVVPVIGDVEEVG